MKKRITALRHHMLPAKFADTGLYTDRVHQRTAAYRLLVHAEFESYMEDVVTAHVAKCVADWRGGKGPSITLAALLAYDEAGSRPPTSLIDPPQKPSPLFADRLTEVVQRFNTHVRVYNHGVREANVLALVLPIGLDAAHLDMAWLTELDSWAHERGELAHQSSGKVQVQLDPAREHARVETLLAGMKQLDLEILRLS